MKFKSRYLRFRTLSILVTTGIVSMNAAHAKSDAGQSPSEAEVFAQRIALGELERLAMLRHIATSSCEELARPPTLAEATQQKAKAITPTEKAEAGELIAKIQAEAAAQTTKAQADALSKAKALVKANQAISDAKSLMSFAKTDKEKLAAHEAMKKAESAIDEAEDGKADKNTSLDPKEALISAVQKNITDVNRLVAEVGTLRRKFHELGEYPNTIHYKAKPSEENVLPTNKVERPSVGEFGDALLAGRDKIGSCALDRYIEAKDKAALPQSVSDITIDQRIAVAHLNELETDYVHIAKRITFDKPQLSLFLGPTLSLNGDDKFKTGVEVAALFDGGAGSFFNIGRVFTDFVYQTKGSVDVARSDDQPPAADDGDPFRKDKGYIRFNTGVSTGLPFDESGRYSVFASGGVTTIPGAGGDFPEALRPRYAIGLLARTFLGSGVYSRLSLSVAHDEYWRQPASATTGAINSYERGVIEGLVLLPNASFSGISTAGRITFDTPLDGKGPSEVRLSILASMDFAGFFDSILKKQKP